MRVLQINSVNYGSTGKIMYSLADALRYEGKSVLCASAFTWHKTHYDYDVKIGNIFTKTFHMFLSKVFGNHGCYSYFTTKAFIRKIKKFNPDIIHLHNIHGWYLNIKVLTGFIKKNNIKVVYTLHDCWTFTGGCAHFTFTNCDNWKSGCGNCNNLNEYPISSKIDKTKKMFEYKRNCFTGIDNLTIVTPSKWLADLAKMSFLSQYPISVINNGIDLSVFKPIVSNFRKKFNLDNYKIILGVSFGWGERKGLDVFVRLSKALPNNYRIVLVGTDDNTDSVLPDNIISIHRTHNQQELAEIYSAADVFVNPTREENYPTVNMESIACGTPVITFKTGGSPEMIDDSCGSVVECDDFDALKAEIIRVCDEKPFTQDKCVKKAISFNKDNTFREYLNLYETIITDRNTTDRT